MNVSSIYDMLSNNCHAKTKYFITDACQGNILASQKGSDRKEKSSFQMSVKDVPAGMIQITSCSTGESSFERNGHGLFSAALIEGIEDKADVDQDGLITITELFDYVSKAVPQEAEDQFGQSQKPSMESRLSGKIIFAVNRQKVQANRLKQEAKSLYEESRKEEADEDKRSKLTEAQEKLDQAKAIWSGGEYGYLEGDIPGGSGGSAPRG